MAPSESPRAKLHLECVVEPEIKLRRMDAGGDLDMLTGSVAAFEVEANTTDGVDVTLTSEHNFHVVNDSDITIPFDPFIKIGEQFEKMGGEGNTRSATIPQKRFVDRKCRFELKCLVSGDVAFGSYKETMTLQITAH